MERVSKTPTRRATRADLPLAGSLAGGGESFKRQVKWDSPARKRAIGFTHLKNRLRYRHLDDPQYPNCFVLRRRAILEKTRLLSCSRPACERCVNTIALAGEGRGGGLAASHALVAKPPPDPAAPGRPPLQAGEV